VSKAVNITNILYSVSVANILAANIISQSNSCLLVKGKALYRQSPDGATSLAKLLAAGVVKMLNFTIHQHNSTSDYSISRQVSARNSPRRFWQCL